MKLFSTNRFDKSFKALEKAQQEAVLEALLRLETDSDYPSLHLKKWLPKSSGIWYCRASRGVRIWLRMTRDGAKLLVVGWHGTKP